MTERGGRSGSNLWGKKQDRARSVTRANPVQVFREEADVNRPRSAAQKWREGERRSERLNLDEPNFGDAAVDPHSSLTTDGEREVWQRLVRILMQAGVLQESDRDALAALCRMQVAFERETDPVQMRHLSRELRALWDLFGLTPRSRAMIQGSARAVDTSDELKRILSTPRLKRASPPLAPAVQDRASLRFTRPRWSNVVPHARVLRNEQTTSSLRCVVVLIRDRPRLARHHRDIYGTHLRSPESG